MGKKKPQIPPSQVDARKKAIKNVLPKIRGAEKKQQAKGIVKRGTARMKKINNRGSR